MSLEMLQALVQQRLHDGVPHEEIRAELSGMGLHPSDVDVLLKAKPPEDLTGRAPIHFWELLPLVPMCIAPLVLMVMAAILSTPTLAIGMLFVGGAVVLMGRLSTIVMAFQEHIAFGIGLFLFPCCVDLMMLFVHKKFWIALGCQFFGYAVMVTGAALDPATVKKFLEDNKIAQIERVGPAANVLCLDAGPSPFRRAA